MSRLELPILDLQGNAYERGLRHGLLFKTLIARNLQIYLRRFQLEGGLQLREVLHRARQYIPVIEGAHPQYLEEMLGVAEGSGFSLEEIAVLNTRYELLYSEASRIEKLRRGIFNCTAFAISRELTMEKHLLMGQNWDWLPGVQGLVLKVRQAHKPDMLCFTQAGVVGGHIGMNSAGLGLLVNGLYSDVDHWEHLKEPFHVRCRRILESESIEQAVKSIIEGRRACSMNFLLAQATEPEAIINIEATPLSTRSIYPERGLLTHANHFEDPDVLAVQDMNDKRLHSCHRKARMQALLLEGRPLTVERAKRILSDHDGYPFGICCHIDESLPEEEHYQTVASVVMDLHELRLEIAAGPPCSNPYRTILF